MKNINTKEYWENRFSSGDWSQAGRFQTTQYAIGNVKQFDIEPFFNGSILDFGCALGDAMPILKSSYPNAKLFGIDISDEAIKLCKKEFGNLANFESGGYDILSHYDIILASHVMEHISNDRQVVELLLTKCKFLYIIVPYMEKPLYKEHVNYYEDDYYDNFNVLSKKRYTISYKIRASFKAVLKSFFYLNPSFNEDFSKDMIMFKLKGSLIN